MINEMRFKGHVYWFGYEFSEEMSSEKRAEFIHYLKWTSERKMPDEELQNFIEQPLRELDRMINICSIECLLYPGLERSPLVKRMIETINDFLPRGVQRTYYELRKPNPKEIGFDWSMFDSEIVENTNQYYQMSSYVKGRLMPKYKRTGLFFYGGISKSEISQIYQRFLEIFRA